MHRSCTTFILSLLTLSGWVRKQLASVLLKVCTGMYQYIQARTTVKFSYCLVPCCTGTCWYVPVCTDLPNPVQVYRIPDDYIHYILDHLDSGHLPWRCRTCVQCRTCMTYDIVRATYDIVLCIVHAMSRRTCDIQEIMHFVIGPVFAFHSPGHFLLFIVPDQAKIEISSKAGLSRNITSLQWFKFPSQISVGTDVTW